MQPKPEIAKRFVFVDALRGLAALAVACFHFYNELRDSGRHAPPWGNVMHTVLTHGDLGVFVFFVLSGFVIACSLHGTRINAGVVGKFALRRSLRLDPSYWAVIFLTLVFMTIVHARGYAPGWRAPSGWDDLANMFYLDNLLGMQSIVKVGWTLCLEIQFYLVFVLIGWLTFALGGERPSQWLRALAFGPLAVASLAEFAGFWQVDELAVFVGYWYMYFLGVVIWWVLSHEVPQSWFILGMLAVAGLAVGVPSINAATALVTGLVIYLAGRLGKFDTWLAHSVFAYLGRISYSFYLLHPLVGGNLLRVLREVLSPDEPFHPLVAVGLFLLALTASISASEIFYRIVELPSHRLSRRIRWNKAKAEPVASPNAADAVVA